MNDSYRDWYLREHKKAADRLEAFLRSQFPCGEMLCGAGGRCRCNDPAPRPQDQLKGIPGYQATATESTGDGGCG